MEGVPLPLLARVAVGRSPSGRLLWGSDYQNLLRRERPGERVLVPCGLEPGSFRVRARLACGSSHLVAFGPGDHDDEPSSSPETVGWCRCFGRYRREFKVADGRRFGEVRHRQADGWQGEAYRPSRTFR